MHLNYKLRITAGKWRSIQIDFLPAPHLRPTGDFARERLFNWLNSVIVGSEVLDLFAGSGVLSFESLSRGAKSATLIDNHFEQVKKIKNNMNKLHANAEVLHQKAEDFLKTNTKKFDIIFLDPPFEWGNLDTLIQSLKPHFKTQAWVYIESNQKHLISNNFIEKKYKQGGRVCYHLWQYTV